MLTEIVAVPSPKMFSISKCSLPACKVALAVLSLSMLVFSALATSLRVWPTVTGWDLVRFPIVIDQDSPATGTPESLITA